MTASATSTMPSTLARHPYIQLAAHVQRASERLHTSAAEVASLLTAAAQSPLTPQQTKRLEALYRMMDEHESRLLKNLNPSKG